MEIGNQPVYGEPQEMPLAENSDVEELLHNEIPLADVRGVQEILEEE
jgi:hypothetical protein